MHNVEQELRRLFELKSEDVSGGWPMNTNLVWRVRLARAVLPAVTFVVIAAAVVGASALPLQTDRGVTPGPADQDRKEKPAETRESYSIPDAPMYLAPNRRGLWAAGFRINHIDLKGNYSTSTENLTGAAKGIAYGFGRVWVATDNNASGRLYGARLEGNEVVVTDEVEISSLRNIGTYFVATGHGAVWVTSADGQVHRYDPDTKQLETFVIKEHFKEYRHSNGALLVTAGDAYMWFAATPGSIVAFDPDTMEPTGRREELGWNVARLAYGAGRVLVLQTTPEGAHRLWRIEEVAETDLGDPIRVGKYGADGVLAVQRPDAYIFRWKSATRSFVYRIDLTTGRVLKQQLVAKDPYEAFTVRGDYGWLGDLAGRRVKRISVPHLLPD